MNAQLAPLALTADLDDAASRLRECKREEDAARARRLAAEEHLIALVGVKTEGSTSIKTDLFKITTTGRLTRSIDEPALLAMRDSLPPDVRERVFPARFALDLTELRSIERHDAALFGRISSVLTVKPAKASVTVELL